MKSERIKGKIKWLFFGTEFLLCFCSYSHTLINTHEHSKFTRFKNLCWIFVWTCVGSQLLTRCFCVLRYAYSRPVILRGLTDNTVRYWINHWLHVETLTSCWKSHSCVCVVKVLLEYRNRTFPECYCRVLNFGVKQTDFVPEIQVAVLQVELTRRVRGPAGSAQYS